MKFFSSFDYFAIYSICNRKMKNYYLRKLLLLILLKLTRYNIYHLIEIIKFF